MEGVSAGQKQSGVLGKRKLDFVKHAEEAEIVASAELRSSFRLMVNDPAFSDVVFLCNDAQRVHALRLLLAGRSQVLKSMLTNGMAESSFSEIKVPDISSPVLLAVFEFLYTGTLCDHQPQDWGIAWNVIIASKFFLLPNLETITRKFLHSLTLAVVDDLPMAASMLTETVALNVTCDNTDTNLMELVKILESNWSHSTFVNSLSEDAFHYLLQNSCYEYDFENGHFSFEEYLRFRQVLRWCAYHSDLESYILKELPSYHSSKGSDVIEELLNFIAPDEKEALPMCRNLDWYARSEGATETVRRAVSYWQANKVAQRSAMKLMSNIDCRWIHPTLLTKVVEPLDVVSCAKMLDSFRHHALRRPMIFRTFDVSWEHGEMYRSVGNGDVEKAGNGVGLAVMTAPSISRSSGTYEWRSTLKKPCHEFAEMGFMYYGKTQPQLDGEKLSDQQGANLVKIHGDEVSANTTETDPRPLWTVLIARSSWPVAVQFMYSARHHICALSINGKGFGICWKHLPCEIYYPAVSLGTASTGHVHADLIRGFDSFGA